MALETRFQSAIVRPRTVGRDRQRRFDAVTEERRVGSDSARGWSTGRDCRVIESVGWSTDPVQSAGHGRTVPGGRLVQSAGWSTGQEHQVGWTVLAAGRDRRRSVVTFRRPRRRQLIIGSAERDIPTDRRDFIGRPNFSDRLKPTSNDNRLHSLPTVVGQRPPPRKTP